MNHKRNVFQKVSYKLGSLLAVFAAFFVNSFSAVSTFAANKTSHPDWVTFYDGAEHWHVLSITRELGQLICVILDKILNFMEEDVYNAVFNSGKTFFQKITRNTVFGSGFGTVVTAFLTVGLVSYGVWILLHTEQTSNTPRFFVRQVVALIGTIVLVPALMGSMWSVVGSWKNETEGQTKATISGDGITSASAQCLEDNITDWYWIAGKGGINANAKSDNNDAGAADAGNTGDTGGTAKKGRADTNEKPRGEINWAATKDKGGYHTCNPWLGEVGWGAIDPSDYITKDSISDYNDNVSKDTIDEMTSKLKDRYNRVYHKGNSTEAREILYKWHYYDNMGKSGKAGQKNKDATKKNGGEIPDDTATEVFVKTEGGQDIKAASGSDNPLTLLFKNGFNNPPYYRYTISWIPMIIELAALAIFYFMVSLKILRIIFDTIITGIVAPLFVSIDFWGETAQRTKTIYRSIVNAFLSVGALCLEVEFFEIFCYTISNMSFPTWYGGAFVKALMYMAIAYIGIKGADIFKKLNLDVDNSATLQAGKDMAMVGARAAHTAKKAVAGAAGLVAGTALAGASALPGLKQKKGNEEKIAGAIGSGADDKNDKNRLTGETEDHPSPLTANANEIDDQMKGIAAKNDSEQSEIKNNVENDDRNALSSTDAKNASEMLGSNNAPGSIEPGEEPIGAVKGANDEGADTASLNAPNDHNGKIEPKAADLSAGNDSGTNEENSLTSETATSEITGQTDADTNNEISDANSGAFHAPGVSDHEDSTDNTSAGLSGISNENARREVSGGNSGNQDSGSVDSGKIPDCYVQTESGFIAPANAVQGEKHQASNASLNRGQESNHKEAGIAPANSRETSEPSKTAGSAKLTGTNTGSNVRSEGTLNRSAERTGGTETNSSAPTGTRLEGTNQSANNIPSATSATRMPEEGARSNLETSASRQTIPQAESGGSYQSYQAGAGSNSTASTSGSPVQRQNNAGRVNQVNTTMGENGAVNVVAGKDSNISISSSSDSGHQQTQSDTYANGALKRSASSAPTSATDASGSYVGFRGPHTTGQLARQEAEYSGKGALGQATANAYGHEMAAINNISAAHTIAKQNRAQNTYTGSDGKTHVHRIKAAGQTIGSVVKGAVKAKEKEYSGYMMDGLSKQDKGSNRDRRREYQSLSEMEDHRPDDE